MRDVVLLRAVFVRTPTCAAFAFACLNEHLVVVAKEYLQADNGVSGDEVIRLHPPRLP